MKIEKKYGKAKYEKPESRVRENVCAFGEIEYENSNKTIKKNQNDYGKSAFISRKKIANSGRCITWKFIKKKAKTREKEKKNHFAKYTCVALWGHSVAFRYRSITKNLFQILCIATEKEENCLTNRRFLKLYYDFFTFHFFCCTFLNHFSFGLWDGCVRVRI